MKPELKNSISSSPPYPHIPVSKLSLPFAFCYGFGSGKGVREVRKTNSWFLTRMALPHGGLEFTAASCGRLAGDARPAGVSHPSWCDVALARSATPSGVRRATPASQIGFSTARCVVSWGREDRLPGGPLRLASQ